LLDSDGIDISDAAYKEYSAAMERHVNRLAKVEQFVTEGSLTNEKVSVKGRNALNELCKDLDRIIKATEQLIPSTGADEKKCGFTKYQLGAVLVRDGFSEYERMKDVNDVVTVFRDEKLCDVADKQQLELFTAYGTQLQRFCDVMADLGLYEVMLKCREFAEEPEEEEPDPIIFIDMKTASVFEKERADAIEEGLVATDGNEMRFKGATKDASELESIVKKVKDHPNLGVATQIVVTKMVNDLDEVGLEEEAAVKNLWGVSLKKRSKNEAGQELLFVDPKTGDCGELSRQKALKAGCLTETTNEFNKVSVEQAEEGIEAREAIICKIRSVLGIKSADD